MNYIPERGDLVRMTFDPQVGHEQAGRRPALVLTPSSYNGRVGLALLCPITSRSKGYPFEVALPDGLPVYGVILCDQVSSYDWKARSVEHIARLPEANLLQVLTKIKKILAL
jgi:mRNA interferase MazF